LRWSSFRYVPVPSIAGAILARLRSKVPAGRAIVKGESRADESCVGRYTANGAKPSR
jgi:hypothetical protein